MLYINELRKLPTRERECEGTLTKIQECDKNLNPKTKNLKNFSDFTTFYIPLHFSNRNFSLILHFIRLIVLKLPKYHKKPNIQKE